MNQFGKDLNLFGQLYGNLYNTTDGTLINFGFVMKNSYKLKKGASLSESEKTINYSSALIYELNKQNKVIFKATIEEPKYRAFKHTFYQNKTDYTIINALNVINTIPKTKLTKRFNINNELKNAANFNYQINMTFFSFDTNYNFNKNDTIEIFLSNNNFYSYSFTIKQKEEEHINFFNLKLKGKYNIYIKINGILYNANQVLEF